jgi:hypothetical protein
VERLVAAFVPIYFGRVGSLVVESRRLSEEQAEEHVERQAREFELRKPYLVERWREAEKAAGSKAGEKGAGSKAPVAKADAPKAGGPKTAVPKTAEKSAKGAR